MAKIKTVYDHIRANNIKTAFLILLFPLIFIGLIFLFTLFVAPMDTAIETCLTVAVPTFVICSIWMLISWAFGDTMILNIAGAHEITDNTHEHREIYRAVENIALASGLPTPRVYIIDDDSMNAFATGRTPHDASIALTRGIINRLDKLELDGVIAHEMAHIGNRDIRLDMMIITGIGVTVFIADIMWRFMYTSHHHRDSDRDQVNITAVILMVWLAFCVFNWLITPLLHMAISRNREYSADATGAHITRNPDALASALRKITTDSRVESLDRIHSVAAICIANPAHTRAFFGNLMSTHPPVSARIARLEQMNLKS